MTQHRQVRVRMPGRSSAGGYCGRAQKMLGGLLTGNQDRDSATMAATIQIGAATTTIASPFLNTLRPPAAVAFCYWHGRPRMPF